LGLLNWKNISGKIAYNSFEDNKEKGDKTTGSFFLMT
jgi:hypothetical protein